MKVYIVIKPGPREMTGEVYDRNGKLRYQRKYRLSDAKPCEDCKTYAATFNNLCNYCADRPVKGMTKISRRLSELYPDPKNRPPSSIG